MLQMQLIRGTWLQKSYPVLGVNIILIGPADSLVPSSYLCLFEKLDTSFALKRFPMQPVRLNYLYSKLLEKRPYMLLSENVSEKCVLQKNWYLC